MPPALKDHVAIVTGANVGLGLEAARQLLARGLSHLVMGVRSRAKGDAAAAALRKQFPGAAVSVWIVDMESYASVQAFAQRCGDELPRIDYVILNAGLITTEPTINEATGRELTLLVNFLSTALLTVLLVPVLKAKKQASGGKKPPVLSIVSTDLVWSTDVPRHQPVLSPFQDPKAMGGMEKYRRSKILLTLFVARLATEYVSAEDVAINLSNPGACKGTDFFRGGGVVVKAVMAVMQALIARTAEAGASNYIDAVLSYGAESHGGFVSDWAVKALPEVWYKPEGRELTDRTWEETVEEFNFAGLSSILEGLKKIS
ncbi:retinol dehydrogenase 12 [Apiospora aurea]|uniref:Retinol dehydrogenase 12 n=1 Tax=Apiospora aurea TaxID=335848 RepID=A0ABR1Q8E5_9PEZI